MLIFTNPANLTVIPYSCHCTGNAECVSLHIRMKESPKISVIIPNHNGSSTLASCLESVCASGHDNFEVIVADDCSTDASVDIIKGFPVKLLELASHGGASRARNMGARAASGEVLFFTDSDCVLAPDTLSKVSSAFMEHPENVLGGTYTPVPYDKGFFSTFQSIYINHSETSSPEPDYIATHAMAISREVLERSGGFREEKGFMPILEDVELSHRLRKAGVRLTMRPEIEVSHIFNFNLRRSLGNAFRKARYWIRYSIGNKDLLADSGTASTGLKAMAACTVTALLLFILGLVTGSILILLLPPLPLFFGLIMNAGIIEAFFRHGGPAFGLMAVPYYTLVFPLAALAGGVAGLIDKIRGRK